jgi:hypothetical protein
MYRGIALTIALALSVLSSVLMSSGTAQNKLTP